MSAVVECKGVWKHEDPQVRDCLIRPGDTTEHDVESLGLSGDNKAGTFRAGKRRLGLRLLEPEISTVRRDVLRPTVIEVLKRQRHSGRITERHFYFGE